MSNDANNTSRRDFLKTSTGLAVGATLAGTLAVPRGVHAGVSETTQGRPHRLRRARHRRRAERAACQSG